MNGRNRKWSELAPPSPDACRIEVSSRVRKQIQALFTTNAPINLDVDRIPTMDTVHLLRLGYLSAAFLVRASPLSETSNAHGLIDVQTPGRY